MATLRGLAGVGAVVAIALAGCGADPEPITATPGRYYLTQPATGSPSSARQQPYSIPAPTECLIKGKITTSGQHIYYLPSHHAYAKQVVVPSRGEKMFCTEGDAQESGWVRAK